MPWPKVTVLSDKFAKGLQGFGQEMSADPCESVDLLRALETEWPTDAHLACYTVQNAAGRQYPKHAAVRVNKAAIHSLEEAEIAVKTSVFFVDLDLPGHVAWSEHLLADFEKTFEEAADQDDILHRWHVFYSTKNGARLGYLLTKPLNVLASESVMRGLLYRLKQTAIAPYVDSGTYDFTRLFRLPQVVRDGELTSKNPYFELRMRENQPRLDPDTISPILTTVRKYGRIQPVTDQQPDPDTAKNLLVIANESTGLPVPTDWVKRARRQLKGRESLDVIQGQLSLANWPEGRNNGLRFVTGQAVNLLYKMPGSSPELLYALFVDTCEQLEAVTGTDSGKHWLDILWHMITQWWEKETAAAQVEDAQVEAAAAAAGKTSMNILTTMLTWCSHPQLKKAAPEALEWMSQHLIAYSDGGYHIMKPNGYYDKIGVNAERLVARIRELKMTGVIPITEDLLVGGQIVRKEIPAPRIIRNHLTHTASVLGVTGDKGCTVSDIGTDIACFRFCMYALRDDILPEWSEDVEEWMRITFGKHFEEVCAWVGHALAFEAGPICALSIDAPPGIGKKLLVSGLAECITTKTTADARELTGRFQNQILTTPFLVINEGLPRLGRDGGADPADSFRAMVSGDTMKIEQKGKGIISVHNPMRVVITANNDDILKQLYKHRVLSQSDREALGRRILHLQLDEAGERWLRGRGGMDYTARDGRRWIRGDDGSQSNWLVAKHFLYLHQNRPPVRKGNRLLMEGNPRGELVEQMAISTAGTSDILETMLQMLEQQVLPEGIEIHKGEIYVTALGVRNFFVALRPFATPPNMDAISKCVRGVSKDMASVARQVGRQEKRTRCWKINKKILLSSAETYGHPCELLSNLVHFPNKKTRHDVTPLQ